MNVARTRWTGVWGILCLGVLSCTKTDIIPAPPEAQNRILSYTITSVPDGEQPVTGVVDDADSTITVYLPSYFQLQVMTPAITLSAGATVTPSSGTLVDNLLTVMQTRQGISYKVTGKDGSSRTYKLYVVSQQPQTVVNELTPDGSEPTSFTMGTSMGIGFGGQNFITENRPELIKVVLTNEQGIDLPALAAQDAFASAATNSFSIQVIRSTAADFVAKLSANGLYKVTIYNYAQVVQLKNPIRIINQP